jgi:hypothetical protein
MEDAARGLRTDFRSGVKLSKVPENPTLYKPAHVLYFQILRIGRQDAIGQGRRSGAQRGALENKLRPEVFLSAPLLFVF